MNLIVLNGSGSRAPDVLCGHEREDLDERHCGPCAPLDIIRRLIGNVAYAFERNGHISQAENMRKLLMFVETGATENLEEPSADTDSEFPEGIV